MMLFWKEAQIDGKMNDVVQLCTVMACDSPVLCLSGFVPQGLQRRLHPQGRASCLEDVQLLEDPLIQRALQCTHPDQR